MSWRMALAVRLARLFVRPVLARVAPTARARRLVERLAPHLHLAPRHLRHLVRHRGGVELHWIGVGAAAPRRVILHFHGGAFVAGSPRTHAAMLGRLSRLARVEVCAPRYPLAPEARFPAAPEAALAAWDALIALGYRPGDIVLSGDSAGGNLAAGLLARVLARDERPAAMVLLSPWADLTLQGAALRHAAGADPVVPEARIAEIAALYLAGADPGDPRASPVRAQFRDPPPVLIQAGAQEVLSADSRRLADRLRAAGGEVVCELWPGCPHVWHLGDGWFPEARAALRGVAAFIQTSFEKASL
ncbi:MAG: alpha/beta hydrolase [Rubellimicrobium sp.]|nr:alpha/beta hydrolase [Rubellimicrobium sp.]